MLLLLTIGLAIIGFLCAVGGNLFVSDEEKRGAIVNSGFALVFLGMIGAMGAAVAVNLVPLKSMYTFETISRHKIEPIQDTYLFQINETKNGTEYNVKYSVGNVLRNIKADQHRVEVYEKPAPAPELVVQGVKSYKKTISGILLGITGPPKQDERRYRIIVPDDTNLVSPEAKSGKNNKVS